MNISVSEVDEILQSEDIEGLLALGSPTDEYSREAARITLELQRLDPITVTSDRISALVMNVWNDSFGPFSKDDLMKRNPVLRQVVQRVLKLTSLK